MNELQIRLTADIQGLQSALAKAKQTLKSFETETATDSEKSNVGFRRKIGLIEQLNAKAKQLKVSLSQATNEQDISSFNAQLEQTNIELTRLNALGKSFANTSTKSFDKFRVSAGAAGGSAIAFNRIIQDAPFGIIGVGNNIQQFTEQLSALRTTTGSTGAALKTFFTSLITPANLVVLAVSAITTAFTAYQLGAFGAKKETEDLSDQLQDYIKTLSGVDKATLDATISTEEEIFKFKTLASVLTDANSSYRQRKNAVDQIQSGYGEYLGNLTDEEILVKGLGKAYENVISALIAKSALEANAKEINKNLKETAELNKKRNSEELRYIELQELLQSKRSNLARTEELIASGEIKGTKRREELKSEIETIIETQNAYNVSIDTGTSAIEKNEDSLKNLIDGYTGSLKALLSFQTGQDEVKESSKGLNRSFDLQSSLLERFNQKIDLSKELTEGLAAEQKRLFETIASLKQAGDIGFNPTLLIIYEQKLAEIDKLIGSIASKRQETEIPVASEPVPGVTPDAPTFGTIEGLQQKIADLERLREVTSDPTQLAKYNEQIGNLRIQLQELTNTKDQTTETINAIVDAFASLGAGIVASLNISNSALRGFVSTLISATPKIIAAISAQANSNLSNAGKNIAADKAESISSGIKQGTKFAEALGPVGLALLPVFIAGAVAVISSAFSKTSSGGSVSPGSGSTYTNRREFGGPVSKGRAYIVGERRPELFVPNTNGIIVPQLPSMDYSGARVNSSMYGVEVMLKGPDDLLFFVEQAQIRRGIR